MIYHATPIDNRKRQLAEGIIAALENAKQKGQINFETIPNFVIEMPRHAAHGDFASNVAMMMGKAMPEKRQFAQAIADNFPLEQANVAAIEIAGPGFINFRFNEGWQKQVLAEILATDNFGHTQVGQGAKVQVEFVSANPTGELHMGNARGAAIGDSLANLLNMAGFNCQREFYINDAGNQIEKFGISLEARYLQALGQDVPFPEDGYHGDDLPRLMAELVSEINDKYLHMPTKERRACLTEYSLQRKLADIKAALANFGVNYDIWFSEQSLHEGGKVQAVIDELQAKGWLIEKDNALWLDCERFGEEKPEVLVRGNGIPTYYAADIAYHRDKYERGFSSVIDVWGADHHGHVARMQGAMEALGYERGRLEIILMQFVRLYQNGELLKMSKRTGTYVTLNELVEEVGKDAARFIFVMRSSDNLIDFDLDLAKKQSDENPVYYVQYAHARICSILAAAAENGLTLSAKPLSLEQIACLSHDSELALIRKLADFPDVVIEAALNREPHRLATYIQESAAQFHNFYNNCRVISDDKALSQARLELIAATAKMIKTALAALGVSAPNKM